MFESLHRVSFSDDRTIYSRIVTIPVAVRNRTYITERYRPYYEGLLLYFCADVLFMRLR